MMYMEYSLFEIEALSYHFGMSCEEVRNTEFTQEEIDRALYAYDGNPYGGGRIDNGIDA